MTSTTTTADLASADSYLKSLVELDDAGLQAEKAKINGMFSKPEVEVDGGFIRELGLVDRKTFQEWCDINYVQQQKTPRTLASNSEGSAREAASEDVQTTTSSTVK